MRLAPRLTLRRCSFVLVSALACEVDATVADDVGLGSSSGPVGTDDGSSSSSSSSADESTTAITTTGAVDESSGSQDEGPKLDVASDETGTTLDDCEEDAPDLIHVLTSFDEIWTFDPIEVEFELFTTVTCPEADQISGFAIDRDSRITLLSYEPTLPQPGGVQQMRLTRMDPGDANCEVLYEGPLADGPVLSVDCADLSLVAGETGDETLYASRCTGGGFGMWPDAGSLFRIDLADAEPSFDLLAQNDYSSVPVAGTGDGRLFGVSGDQETPGSTVILEFDPESGTILATTPVPEIDIGTGGAYFALAFYGGDLYTFGRGDGGETLIHGYDWDDDDGDGDPDVTPLPEAEDAPFSGNIFAAASPTCIPLGPAG